MDTMSNSASDQKTFAASIRDWELIRGTMGTIIEKLKDSRAMKDWGVQRPDDL
jgi:hypothetical protein